MLFVVFLKTAQYKKKPRDVAKLCMHKFKSHCVIPFQIGGNIPSEIRWSTAIGGRDLSQCGNNPCANVPCRNDGDCLVIDDSNYRCLCGVGWMGTQCEQG